MTQHSLALAEHVTRTRHYLHFSLGSSNYVFNKALRLQNSLSFITHSIQDITLFNQPFIGTYSTDFKWLDWWIGDSLVCEREVSFEIQEFARLNVGGNVPCCFQVKLQIANDMDNLLGWP
jgi:hypothetical protein